MTRIVIDAPTLLHVVAGGLAVHADHQLVAPQALRSQALSLLFDAVGRGELTESAARSHHESLTRLRVRLLGDRVSRWTAWTIARDHALEVGQAEYLAVTRLQADVFVSVDPVVRSRAAGIVPVGTVDGLTSGAASPSDRGADPAARRP